MLRQHHQLNAHEFEQTRREGGGQGSLGVAVHGVAESDMTQQLNSNNYDF